MKKSFLIPILLCLLIFSSCNKNVKELQAISNVDLLFNQLKNEPVFLDYLINSKEILAISRTNFSNLSSIDSAVVRDKSLNMDQKYKALGLTNIDEINIRLKKTQTQLDFLGKKYPLLNSLTNEESKLLFKKAFSHYFKPKK